MMETGEENNNKPELRPDELVPYVREYLGLIEEKNVLDAEMKRCIEDYKKIRERLLNKRRPIHDRVEKLEDILKRTIVSQKLPGIKYKQYVFTIEEKPIYKPSIDKIVDALNHNPIEHFSNDKKTLAKIIADAVKKKIRDHSDKNDLSNMTLKTRIIT